MSDLKILITGSLDTDATTIEINKQLKQISNKIKLDVGIDVKEISKAVSEIQKAQSKLTNSKGSLIDGKDISSAKEFYTSIDKAVEKFKNLGSVNISKSFDPATQQLNKFQLSITKANGEVERLKFELANLKNIGGVDGFVLTGKNVVDKTSDIREKQLQSQQKLNKEIDIQNQKIDEQNKKLQHQLDMFKKQQEINSNNLTRRFSGKFDDTELKGWQSAVNKLKVDTPNLSQEMDKLGLHFKQMSSEVRSSSSHVLTFGESVATAFSRYPVWLFTAGVFSGSINALQDMASRLVEIDTLMTEINRVMDVPQFRLNDLLNESVVASDKLSSKLTDMLSIVGEFSRMGDFSNKQLIDMSSTATVLQNISDLDAQSSVDTLTSAMLNFNIAASDSITISDKLNEVDNNYAVTTKDLSDGIRKSAATAKTFGVDLDQLTGYIAAIGSTTRESGAIIGKLVADIKSFLIDLELLTYSRG